MIRLLMGRGGQRRWRPNGRPFNPRDAANQLLLETAPSGARTTYTNDNCGNRTLKDASGGSTYYTWDPLNRMTVAEPPAGRVTMAYNADYKRVKKEAPSEVRKFIYCVLFAGAVQVADAGSGRQLSVDALEDMNRRLGGQARDQPDRNRARFRSNRLARPLFAIRPCGTTFLVDLHKVAEDWQGVAGSPAARGQAMDQSDSQWDVVIDGLRRGDPRVLEEFCARYGPTLERVAEKRLPGALRRRVGPEDVVQSACRTFLRRARIGEFHLPDSKSLWQLLCAITLTKVREQARFHLRQRRRLDREVPLPSVGGAGEAADAAFTDPAVAVEFADQFQKLMEVLDEEERAIIDLKLQDLTNDEIAAQLGCSERTVRRMLRNVQARLGKWFETEAS